METQVRTPQLIFMQPQRLVVPLFQRPYVWNEENQWEPLWEDLTRIASRLINNSGEKNQAHFLGAVVLQQIPKQTGLMQERTIIDGQQRLTTLQILLDALASQLLAAQATQPAKRLEALVRNAEPFCSAPEDRFKVWPTNRDRPAFYHVMNKGSGQSTNGNRPRGDRIVEAHRFFCEQAELWLKSESADEIQKRAVAIETAARDLLQIVVIDLTADENAQEIFETLNARGAQLSAADLIKNFIFQRLQEDGADVEIAYQRYWKEFETGFWETEISVGRLRYPRSALFLNHWLVAKTGEEVVAREVFDRFKRYADESALKMEALLKQIHLAAGNYRTFITAAQSDSTSPNPIDLFAYRTSVLESEVVKPLVICLFDADQAAIPEDQLLKCLNVVESWMVRRMLVRATTKSYSQAISEMISRLSSSDRIQAGDIIESYLTSQRSAGRYWPDNIELTQELTPMQAYRRLGRGRLRMVLEGIEDHLRGWKNGRKGLGNERVPRGKLAIEHIMPRKWQANWPISDTTRETERDRLIHSLGNLTLLTTKLNSKVSNGPWVGAGGKREGLEAHDVLFLNRELLKNSEREWTEDSIRQRSEHLVGLIENIWQVPANYKSEFAPDKPKTFKSVELADLLNAGMLQIGMALFPRRRKYSHVTATLLSDGKIDVDGKAYVSANDAATAIAGRKIGGWWFFLVDQDSKQSLRDIRHRYIETMAVQSDDEDDEDDEEDA
ncbi:GmrSD restriction endonuclease domain-containing protein [Bradyrhizobium sp. HKCCYLS2033]|uniref:GmrSD restriction endonuclease domain-containing protein n=1 Tax=unclassified Bradyrhizobium TaxID=2631580 RepID=UPI003EBAC507